MWTCCDEYGVEAGCRPCSHTQGGSKPEPEEEEEQSSESSAGAEAARHAAHNPRKRRRFVSESPHAARWEMSVTDTRKGPK